MQAGPSPSIRTCACCGLAQAVPAVPAGQRACCARCGLTLQSLSRRRRGASRTAAIAAAALILYPFAVGLPVMRVERLGHAHETSIARGTVDLLADGEIAVGLIVLVCSVLVPLFKLLALFALTAGARRLRVRHKAWTYRVVEWTGRFGMLDVLLVALTVAVLKLGDVVSVTVGPGAAAFAGCVLLSLLATLAFDPHELWEGDP
jgi:paraquat-inducible protein A